MKVFINGKPDELDEVMTIARLLERRKARPEIVSVEVNDRILQREEYAKTILREGDAVEIVFFMGGGREA
ncbi:MAG: sulfur carrier protein ThiS [Nitrospirae bacterium]|nr:sulfur carrier protein ThiS [Nitrospirota bacterium]